MEVLSAEQVSTIIESALDVLEQQGMCFLEDKSRKILRLAGATEAEGGCMIRFDRGMVRELTALAPSQFPLRARNPSHDLLVGGNNILFASIGGPAFCSDLDRGRRPGTHAELCDYLRLVQSLNILHQEGGGAFEAMDLPPESRHLDLYLAQLTLMDKNAQANLLGRARTLDCLEMTAISLGTDRDGLAESPAVLGIINTNSPRQLDIPMSEAVREMAAAQQVSCITPFTLAGSMSPITLAGTLVQQTAEVLAVVVLAQAVKPRCAGDVWFFRLQCRYAKRSTCAGYTRVCPNDHCRRTDCPSPGPAFQIQQYDDLKLCGCAIGLREPDVAMGLHHGTCKPCQSRRRLA